MLGKRPQPAQTTCMLCKPRSYSAQQKARKPRLQKTPREARYLRSLIFSIITIILLPIHLLDRCRGLGQDRRAALGVAEELRQPLSDFRFGLLSCVRSPQLFGNRFSKNAPGPSFGREMTAARNKTP